MPPPRKTVAALQLRGSAAADATRADRRGDSRRRVRRRARHGVRDRERARRPARSPPFRDGHRNPRTRSSVAAGSRRQRTVLQPTRQGLRRFFTMRKRGDVDEDGCALDSKADPKRSRPGGIVSVHESRKRKKLLLTHGQLYKATKKPPKSSKHRLRDRHRLIDASRPLRRARSFRKPRVRFMPLLARQPPSPSPPPSPPSPPRFRRFRARDFANSAAARRRRRRRRLVALYEPPRRRTRTVVRPYRDSARPASAGNTKTPACTSPATPGPSSAARSAGWRSSASSPPSWRLLCCLSEDVGRRTFVGRAKTPRRRPSRPRPRATARCAARPPRGTVETSFGIRRPHCGQLVLRS